MELYKSVAYNASRRLTLAYSSSFGLSSRLFAKSIRPHIYAIYGLVRIADEIVDTYKGTDAQTLLDDLETETYRAIRLRYSTNPIVHAFALTADHYGITDELIRPFFESMAMDLAPKRYKQTDYERYIHGSAEVVGLMCLRVFCKGDDAFYERLRPGAASLGSAYQKVNFLRDIAADHAELGRTYFPDVTFDTFDDEAKRRITADIRADFKIAHQAIAALPASSRLAVMTSYKYYLTLLKKLERTPAETIKSRRVRVSGMHKLWLLLGVVVTGGRA